MRNPVSCIFVFCFLSTFIFTSCSKKAEIVVGFVGGLSGRVADLGIAGRNGVVLAVEELNANGGINGQQVKLIVANDKQDPETAKVEVNRLISQGAVAIIGHMTSSMTVLTVPIVNEKRVVMVSPTATSAELSGKDDYFFRVTGTTTQYAQSAAKRLFVSHDLRNLSVLYDLNNENYTAVYYEEFKKTFENLGGSVPVAIGYQANQNFSFFEKASAVISDQTQGVLLITSAMDSALFAQQIKKIRPDILIVTSEWAATEKLIEIGGEAVEGVYLQQFFDRENREQRYLQFKKSYIKRFGNSPGFASVGGYDAAQLVFAGLKRKNNSKSLKDTILSIGTFTGIQGDVVIDQYGDSNRQIFPSVVKNGRLVVVK